MDSFELNKIIGAILGTLLFVMGVGFLAEAIYHPVEGAGPGYALPEPSKAAARPRRGGCAGGLDRNAARLGRSGGRAGRSAKKCQSCHDFTRADANKTGPESL